jgi:periplasmic divalent cation tolerance protein
VALVPVAQQVPGHSYDVPEIIAIPITGGSAEYLSWLVYETRG